MPTYRQLREALEAQLLQLSGLPEMTTPALLQLVEKLPQNRGNLVILGAFKRGKSSLINALSWMTGCAKSWSRKRAL